VADCHGNLAEIIPFTRNSSLHTCVKLAFTHGEAGVLAPSTTGPSGFKSDRLICARSRRHILIRLVVYASVSPNSGTLYAE